MIELFLPLMLVCIFYHFVFLCWKQFSFFWSIFSFTTALSNFVQVHVIHIHWIIWLTVSFRSQILTWYLFKSSFLFSIFQFLVVIYNFGFCSLNIVGNLSLIISISKILPSSAVSAGDHSWCLIPLSISFPLTVSGTLYFKN